jgi:hypothetical protein
MPVKEAEENWATQNLTADDIDDTDLHGSEKSNYDAWNL